VLVQLLFDFRKSAGLQVPAAVGLGEGVPLLALLLDEFVVAGGGRVGGLVSGPLCGLSGLLEPGGFHGCVVGGSRLRGRGLKGENQGKARGREHGGSLAGSGAETSAAGLPGARHRQSPRNCTTRDAKLTEKGLRGAPCPSGSSPGARP